jgi:predicted RNA-binding protein YlqC (UPF0109 family)
MAEQPLHLMKNGVSIEVTPVPTLDHAGNGMCCDYVLHFSSRKGNRVMKELIQYIAEALVDAPDQVKVSVIDGEQTTVLELQVAKDDLGKIIGKKGRTAQAMRTILACTSAKTKKRILLEIVE